MFGLTRAQICVVTALVSVAVIAGAFYFQYVVGLFPCEMCLWQRIPHYVAVPLALLTALAIWAGRQVRARILHTALAGTFLVSAGLGLWHSGVERKWWPSPVGCSVGQLSSNPTDLLRDLMAIPVVRCDEIAWSLFGLSMANYNLLISAVMAAVLILSLKVRA
jgi:disulfide bond formation protein DsbB